MRSIALALLIISIPSPSYEMEIICKTSLHSSKKHRKIRYGDCESIDSKYNGSKLRIHSTHSIKNGGFESIDIDAHTSYSLIPSKSPHLVAPDVYHNMVSKISFDMRTHYYDLSAKVRSTMCSPLHCISSDTFHYVILLPYYHLPTTTNLCDPEQYLPIGFMPGRSSPIALCFTNQKSRITNYPQIEQSYPYSLFYFSLTPEITKLLSFEYSEGKKNAIAEDIQPTVHTSPIVSLLSTTALPSRSVTFYSYDLSSYIDSEASGFSLSHNLHPLYPNPERVYSIKTPTRVYSLLKKNNGGFTLFPEPGEEDNVADAELTAKSYFERVEAHRADEKTYLEQEEDEEEEVPNYQKEPHRKTLIIHTFKDSDYPFNERKDIGPVGRFGALYREGDAFQEHLQEDEETGLNALKRFFDLEKTVGGDWNNVPETIRLASGEAEKGMFKRQLNFLYNWMGFLRSKGAKKGEGVYMQWADLIIRQNEWNWDARNVLYLEPPTVVKDMSPPVPQSVMEEREKKEDLRGVGSLWEEISESERGFWERYWMWIAGVGVAVAVFILVVASLLSKEKKEHTTTLLL